MHACLQYNVNNLLLSTVWYSYCNHWLECVYTIHYIYPDLVGLSCACVVKTIMCCEKLQAKNFCASNLNHHDNYTYLNFFCISYSYKPSYSSYSYHNIMIALSILANNNGHDWLISSRSGFFLVYSYIGST